MIKYPNKHNLMIIGNPDDPRGDIYHKEVAERNFNRLNSLFGIIDSNLETCKPGEGGWYLQNILFNLLARMDLKTKPYFLEGASSMYDLLHEQKERIK